MFIADLIACSTCFGHHYAHHQELESIIQVVAACRIWCLVFKLSVWCGAAIKIHLLHLVGVLFPRSIDDAQSKPHKIQNNRLLFDIIINLNTVCAFIHISFSPVGVSLHPITGNQFLSPKYAFS